MNNRSHGLDVSGSLAGMVGFVASGSFAPLREQNGQLCQIGRKPNRQLFTRHGRRGRCRVYMTNELSVVATVWKNTEVLMDRATSLFPLWVLISAILGVMVPHVVSWFQGAWVIWTLSVIMLGMGLTLPLSELVEALKTPQKVLFGALAQFSIMPLLGLLIAKLLGLSEAFTLGLVLVSTCPGGTASNLVCLLCNANVSLSVLMTTTTTLMAVVATPLLLKVLVARIVTISASSLMLSTAQMILLPLAIGICMQRFTPKVVSAVSSTLPFISVVGVSLICSSIVAINSQALLASGSKLLLAVFLLHLFGFLLGYFFAKLVGFRERDARTVSIEVGMQNSGLGAALAQLHFVDPLTAVPAAISATTHSILGSLLAAIWLQRDKSNTTSETESPK